MKVIGDPSSSSTATSNSNIPKLYKYVIKNQLYSVARTREAEAEHACLNILPSSLIGADPMNNPVSTSDEYSLLFVDATLSLSSLTSSPSPSLMPNCIILYIKKEKEKHLI